MDNNSILINDCELLGRVLDGCSVSEERTGVLADFADMAFKECFMVALRATVLFNEKNEIYETVN